MKAADFSPKFRGIFTFERIFFIIIIAALLVRFLFLDLKLFHHDEAIHAWFSYRLLTEGTYTYDPVYHGPFLYYATAGMFALFGDSDLIGRVLPAVLGTATVALVYPVYRLGYLSRNGTLIAALFLAISPNMVYFSRFLRNDIFVVFFTMLLLVAVLYYLECRQRRYVLLAAAAAGLGMCCKENMPIIIGTFGLWLMALVFWKKKISLHTGWWKDVLLWVGGTVCIMAVLYSSFGTQPEVVMTGWLDAIDHWTAMHSQQRLGGPPYFYMMLFLLYEVPIVLFAAIGIGQFALPGRGAAKEKGGHSAGTDTGMEETGSSRDFGAVCARALAQLRGEAGAAAPPAEMSSGGVTGEGGPSSRLSCTPERRQYEFMAFAIFWMGISLLAYAYIGEKVPWLILHQLLPMIFVAAYMMSSKKAVIAVITSLFLVVMMAHVAFTPADINEPIVQVQNSEDLRTVMAWIDASDRKAAITGEHYWPMPWYYRGGGSEKISYLGSVTNPEYFADGEYGVVISDYPAGFDEVPGYEHVLLHHSYWFSIYDNEDRLAEYYFRRDGEVGSVKLNVFVLSEGASGPPASSF
ncbi:glycosyl transferase [Methanomicrobiaceae archaeon CYW5]|uniref:flippase activity-associated protein Agl23 n=1 Tax=Methanovulcanius yangii TaxID=1789227 RepID=UPI0029CA653D|nr:flippase activity-associated protein Agl23 [Methanovulcanius yangii]MBT8507006.1 glycosyl transferase [Methanovulcanius yangii]